ncbi:MULTISPECIES: lactonase family protein [unclassified Crossiella]|uniref:lactonase family protein n=1 Tax=unclassified Crossiella TaxID=2620835 RepID=UPI001FFF674E|nr:MULTISPECIES: lactonase family protein [unclassified Crossiella]MCK2240509.1 lactonase family protein [Crossiella sp. S99.2]MCK2253040.1 lactonase family protein [Crossiella sp. S99.1]
MADVGRRTFLGALGAAVVGGGLMSAAGTASAGTPEAGGEVCAPTGRVYLGTYTDAASGGKGIGLAKAGAGGGLTVESTVATESPSYIAVGPGGRTVYAVNELDKGTVSAFALADNGSLRSLGARSSGGAHPCHLTVHPSGKYVLTANYTSGTVGVLPIRAGGALGNPTHIVQHPGKPHAHQVVVSPDGKHVLATDLGTSSVYTYTLDLNSGRLTLRSTLALAKGAGSRNLVFHPDGRTVYILNELDSTLVVAAYDPATGKLTAGQRISTLPPGTTTPNFPGGIAISPDGRFVYGANRGHNSVAVFATSEGGRKVTLAGTPGSGGDWPRHLEITPDGRTLYSSNQRGNVIGIFGVDPVNGLLKPSGELRTPTPVCAVVA